MKYTAYCLFLAAYYLFFSLSAAMAQQTPIEPRATISRDVRPSTVQALAEAVRIVGYRCDSVSAAVPFIASRGFTLSCNRSAYTYEFSDIGGRIHIRVK